MDPRKLAHFLAVIEHGQFNLAAEATGVTQQAVSKAIAKLEDELGVQLFERSAFGAAPTQFARALQRYAQAILAEARLASAELDALSGAKIGTLHVGAGLTLARGIIARTIHRFHMQRPGIGISISVDISQSMYQRLLRGEIDLVASAPPEHVEIPADITTERLFLEHDLIMVRPNHPLTSMEHVGLADLAHYTWLAPVHNHGIWVRICAAYAAAGIAPPQKLIRTDSVPAALGLLTTGDCVSLLGREMMTYELSTGAVVALPRFAELSPDRPVMLAHRTRGPLSPAAKAFIPLLREVCKGAPRTPEASPHTVR